MTYRQMMKQLQDLAESPDAARLDDDVTIAVVQCGSAEFFCMCDIVIPYDWGNSNDEAKSALVLDQVDGVLDDGHIYMTVFI